MNKAREIIGEYQDLTRPELIELLKAKGYTITEPELRQWIGDGLVKYEHTEDEKKRFRYSIKDIERVKIIIIKNCPENI